MLYTLFIELLVNWLYFLLIFVLSSALCSSSLRELLSLASLKTLPIALAAKSYKSILVDLYFLPQLSFFETPFHVTNKKAPKNHNQKSCLNRLEYNFCVSTQILLSESMEK